MRVLMLNRSDAFSVPGGDTVQMVETKRALERLGVQVEIASADNPPPFDSFHIIHLINWEQLPLLFSARPELTDGDPPVVLSTVFCYETGYWYADAVQSKRLWRLVDAAAGETAGRRLYEHWQILKFRRRQGAELRGLFPLVRQMLPNSFNEVERLRLLVSLGPEFEGKCSIIPSGISRELYGPKPEPDEAFAREFGVRDFVLQVGRIHPMKNQLGLMKALYDTSHPIVFVGQPSPHEPSYVKACHDFAARRKNVLFAGVLPDARMPGIYALAAVHVLPSWMESLGLVSVEAAASGCRVVSTRIGAAREYLGNDARYCDPGDLRSIRNAVLSALAAPKPERLREKVLARYTWDAAAAATLKVYERAADVKQYATVCI